MGVFLSTGLLCLSLHISAVPVILDTDIGDDIDDTWALCMLIGSPHADLKLVVTASDDTPTKTRLVAKMLERMGRTDIPIGTGKKNSDRPIHQADWLGDYTLDNYPGVVYEDGVQALIDAIHAGEGKVVLCVIGPQTNLAEALQRDPSIAGKTRVVTMAGSVHIGYGGKETPEPEWNVRRDLEAAKAVFAAPWEISMAPLDTCGTLILKGERYRQVAESQTARARVVMENYAAWRNRRHYPQDESSVLFDTLAIGMIYDESHVAMETVKLSIDDKGMTVPDEKNGRPVRCALHWKDRDGFEKHLVACLVSP